MFFCILLGFTIACVSSDTGIDQIGIDEIFYIVAFVSVLLLLQILQYLRNEYPNDESDVNNGRERLAQVGVSVFVVCTGLFVLVMVLRSDHGVRLDHHTTAPTNYSFYTVFLTGVWCIGWALWMRHCNHNAEASVKPEECGVNIPGNATGLAQVIALMINTYSFAGFSFAPSIPWTTAPSSISPVPIFVPVSEWYSNYVSVA
jgi:cytochrome bd-type quinol oxidase subunit 2